MQQSNMRHYCNPPLFGHLKKKGFIIATSTLLLPCCLAFFLSLLHCHALLGRKQDWHVLQNPPQKPHIYACTRHVSKEAIFMSIYCICGDNSCTEENKWHVQRKIFTIKSICILYVLYYSMTFLDIRQTHGSTCGNLALTLRLACVLRDLLAWPYITKTKNLMNVSVLRIHDFWKTVK